MNRKSNLQNANAEALENSEYAVRRNRRFDLIALLISFLVAILVWIVIMNLESTEELSLSLSQNDPALCYELSCTEIQVRGRLADIKGCDAVTVKLPEGLSAGDCYALSEKDLCLPEGVALACPLDLFVTVRQK